ncbi:MAG: DNA-binding protein [Sulfurimonas sp. RIFOXYD12_FULL_33_39]|uniref:ComEA family DNA-binding protein n=1 Tax=unclassified Sulfurimonas TaxID=2623549 RepID=UPI0008C9EFCC|nr:MULTISPECIES: helix-hairpin-helix domain-containing protein [unclassified Sulfurimonas]OHE05950.1 MAG: DNA-binding protein [Sulfurimonas sp. RIFCSPLOWO2_12_FULL_34_6]OHE10410.1 MAG: DNA-binding protein [Sulfurimonas sp. RIFOXYD12_FULL_33_39]OHE14867.1 MAG: DNA-binding protein [Sulfurimonas sp. RIFOXYD2_FULL_34_21]DAB27892.1 MAG TPA: DNA-binding protein [Sulfurimonas sp. UBA10385]
MKLLLWLLIGFTLSFGAVDINKADKKELMSIKGIGDKKADMILDYRKEHNCFKSVDEIKEVKGFGDKFLEKNRTNLTASECKKK